MFHVISRENQKQSPNRTILFEGGAFGAPVSIFLIDNEPGQGPALHIHPYTEMWIVRSGQARFTVGEETLDPNPGDIVVVNAETPHCFKNVGTTRLELTCIHAGPEVIQSWV
ncbi:cupin domain-containing protein [Rhizobium sp. 21-4511-3d]